MHDVLAVSGVTTRGVLLDIAKLRGVDMMAADDHIYPEDLEAAEEAAGVRVEPGDVLFVRAGEGVARRAERRNYNGTSPAPATRRPACPGSRAGGGHDRLRRGPGPHAHRLPGVHHAGPHGRHRGHGPVADRQLPAGRPGPACNTRNRWEFHFALAPIRFVGVTGCPVNPLAIF